MRITLLTSWLSRRAGGLFTLLPPFGRALITAGASDVTIWGLEDRALELDREAWAGVRIRAFPIVGFEAFGFAPAMASSLKSTPADLVHTVGLWMYPSVVASRWSGCSGRPYLVSPQGMLDPWALRNSAWKKRVAAWLYEGAHLRGAACLHALCEAEAESFRAYGLRNPIAVIPNAVDLPEAGPRPAPDSLDLAPPDAKVLLYLGRLHPKKGLVPLVEAWAASRRGSAASQWRLVIAGWDQDGHEAELRDLARRLGVDANVVFAGPQFADAKDRTFRRADAFILPSFSEGLPMAVLEAWSYGLPVLMTPQCNLPQGFTSGAALRVDPQTEGIHDGLQHLFAMPDLERRQMGEAGLRLVRDQFAWPRIAAEMTAVYQWVLGAASKPPCLFDG